MNKERRKSIIIIVITLVFGILLGLLIPATVHKVQRWSNAGQRELLKQERKNRFTVKLMRVLEPDSTQRKQIKPSVEWAATRIESIETAANSQIESVLDSLDTRIKPVLSEDQKERLAQFRQRAARKDHRHGRGGR
jgi:hypothetical protein